MLAGDVRLIMFEYLRLTRYFTRKVEFSELSVKTSRKIPSTNFDLILPVSHVNAVTIFLIVSVM